MILHASDPFKAYEQEQERAYSTCSTMHSVIHEKFFTGTSCRMLYSLHVCSSNQLHSQYVSTTTHSTITHQDNTPRRAHLGDFVREHNVDLLLCRQRQTLRV